MFEDMVAKIREVDSSISDLQKMADSGIIDSTDVTLLRIMKTKRTLIKEYVDKVHSGKISEPTSSVPFYHTYLKGRKKIKASSLDRLYDKLYEIYAESMAPTKTFESIFKKALAERGEVRSAGTVVKYQKDFDRFISKEFAEKDITTIDNNYLKQYTVDMIKRLKLKNKAFSSYKSVLNLAFDYAVSNDIVEYNVATRLINKDYYRICENEYKSAESKAMSPKQIEEMCAEIYQRMEQPKKYGVCYTCGFMVLLSTMTGMRAGELCSLKWEDIDYLKERIHIHTQQLKNRLTNEYEYVLWTKNEKGISKGGRYFPLTNDIKKLLERLKECQKKAGLDSEWLFCNQDGSWIKADMCYEKALYRLCKNKSYSITNNHAIRIYFNSYVLIPKGVSVTNRAKLLGHSVEVNLKFYSFADYDYCEQVGDILNHSDLGTTRDYNNVYQFTSHRKSKAL